MDEGHLAEAEREIGNLLAAIKADILTPTTKAELEKAERARSLAALNVDTGALAGWRICCPTRWTVIARW